MIQTIFGSNDETPRGIQERKDMYWIVLAVEHRKLRMELQQKRRQDRVVGRDSDATTSSNISDNEWLPESKEEIADLVSKAASDLDDQSDIDDMSLRNLRIEIQKLLEGQVLELLITACNVEERMKARGDSSILIDDENDYGFSEEETKEYKAILLAEYDHVRQLLQDYENGSTNDEEKSQRTSDPMPFYKIKMGAIETVLDYYGWKPENATEADAKYDDEEDEFGFAISTSDPDILPAMRYYHVRNLIRTHLVRNQIDANKNDTHELQRNSYHSILPLKSSVPNAGRGVYIDGFAPAGTLLAFFPGKVWPKEHLMTASLQTQMEFSQNNPRHQLSMRYDDILIDSRRSPYTVVANLWALGHIVNHPPAPLKSTESSSSQTLIGPNCVSVPINYTESMLKQHTSSDIKRYIPNEYELPPQPWAKNAFDREKVVMHGMGLVALRDVKDEELFYDYRLSPDESAKKRSQYPPWYHVWDAEAMNNRWSIEEE
jgi:hypothetical protein